MGHSIKTLCHERLFSNPPTNMAMPDTNNSLVNVPKTKKHIALSKEIAIPKTITFPTPKTPIRYPSPTSLVSRILNQ
ncbi:hypothetical protein N7G274_002650 [Stereocaulon virgatum]|uniref:Uncharacterized protein n=1 Tax=Stereocaulon virgatum TaxID=373712 RepID=A0ABR4AHE1_9LECA